MRNRKIWWEDSGEAIFLVLFLGSFLWAYLHGPPPKQHSRPKQPSPAKIQVKFVLPERDSLKELELSEKPPTRERLESRVGAKRAAKSQTSPVKTRAPQHPLFDPAIIESNSSTTDGARPNPGASNATRIIFDPRLQHSVETAKTRNARAARGSDRSPAIVEFQNGAREDIVSLANGCRFRIDQSSLDQESWYFAGCDKEEFWSGPSPTPQRNTSLTRQVP